MRRIVLINLVFGPAAVLLFWAACANASPAWTAAGASGAAPSPRAVTAKDLMAVSFVNLKVGWVTGKRGIILRTTNGGHTWVKQHFSPARGLTPPDFTCVQALNGQTCWAVGEGYVIKTTNGGKTWVRVATKMYNRDAVSDWWTSLAFVNTKVGWVLSTAGDVMKTTNGGASWKWMRKMSSAGQDAAVDIAAAGVGSVFFSGKNAAGGFVDFSSDGGATWTTSRGGIANWTIMAVRADSATNVWIATENGSVFASTNGAKDWSPSHWGSWTGPFYGLASAGGTTVCAVGANGDYTKGEAWISTNAGAVWGHITTTPGDPTASTTSYPLEAVDFVTANTGWIVGDHGQIWRTEDGGASLQKQN
jgi:photosystem II stability/assembly factor-like uncharacterized protein